MLNTLSVYSRVYTSITRYILFILLVKPIREPYEDFCLELYLRNPMEMDANKFAYKEMENIIRKNIGIFGDDNISLMDLGKIIRLNYLLT